MIDVEYGKAIWEAKCAICAQMPRSTLARRIERGIQGTTGCLRCAETRMYRQLYRISLRMAEDEQLVLRKILVVGDGKAKETRQKPT